jgi:ATP-binding cassette, subfamily C (CFTR/MRP), member 1
MDTLCPNGEGWGPGSSKRPFDFTPCFEDTVLLGVPASVFVLFALFNLWNLSKAREIPHRKSWVLRIKTVSSTLSQ